jgi:hypothetical protein
MPSGSKVALSTSARRDGDIGERTGSEASWSAPPEAAIFAARFERRSINPEI